MDTSKAAVCGEKHGFGRDGDTALIWNPFHRAAQSSIDLPRSRFQSPAHSFNNASDSDLTGNPIQADAELSWSANRPAPRPLVHIQLDLLLLVLYLVLVHVLLFPLRACSR